jgi:hypothetical protein
MCRGVHGRIADGVGTGRAVGDTVGFPRTATDGARQRAVQVRCRRYAPPGGRHHFGGAGAATEGGRAVRQAVAFAAPRERAARAPARVPFQVGLSRCVIHQAGPAVPNPRISPNRGGGSFLWLCRWFARRSAISGTRPLVAAISAVSRAAEGFRAAASYRGCRGGREAGVVGVSFLIALAARRASRLMWLICPGLGR